MTIADQFPSYKAAGAFVDAMQELYPSLACTVFTSVEDAQAADPFPFPLVAPIVHIERAEDDSDESPIWALIRRYEGVYAGT